MSFSNRILSSNIWQLFTFFLVCLSFCSISSAEIVPSGALDLNNINTSGRRINWDPGVRGGIPTRTVCKTLPLSATTKNIQDALIDATCIGYAVELAAGTYTINATIKIPSNVTLRGQGMGITTLKGSSSFSGDSLISFDAGFDENWGSTHYSLTSPKKGETTLTTTTAHDWKGETTQNGVVKPGDVLLIDMLEQPTGNPPIDAHGSLGNCNWCGRETGSRPIAQWVYVKSVPTSTTAVIDPPLYWTYTNTPKATKMTGLTYMAGVEDLTLDNMTSVRQDTVAVFGAVNSWLLRLEIKGQKRRAFWGYGGFWFTIQGCKIWSGITSSNGTGSDEDLPSVKTGGGAYDSDRSYGIFFGPHFAASLVTDNIFEKLTMAIAYEGGASGNVFSYNYIGQMWWNRTENTGTAADQPRRFGPLMHGPHPFMNLIEGNISEERFRADEYWGTSSHFTLLRNRIHQRHREPTGKSSWSMSWLLDIERRNWYYNIIGNYLGDIGTENRYELYNETFAYEGGPQAIYKLGFPSLGDKANDPNFDPNVKATLYRQGNWVPVRADSSTGIETAFVCKFATDASCVIPNSYYLTQKPTWFNNASGRNLRWPPIDTSNTALMECPIPAQLRYNPSLTVNANCLESSSGAPSAPSNLTVN